MIFDDISTVQSFENQTIPTYKSEIKSPIHLYFIAGLHGDSVESIYVMEKLYEWLSNDHSMQDLPLIAIPILNIDGYMRQTKENSRGIDLNTNFPTEVTSEFTKSQHFLSEPETQYLSNLFKKFKPALVVHFITHTNPTITYEGEAQSISTFLSKLNSYPTRYEKILDRGTLCHYGWHYFHAPVVNIFLPRIHDELTLDEIWKHNESSLKKLFLSDLLLKYL